ncbi:MAG: AEC family transporter [Ruminococcaceae bacterium]|nr:AEC family transporter [Oscillospiraceae bacterium]
MFFESMTNTAQQVLILYLIVAVGFAADKLKVFKQTTAKLSNDLLFYIITPCVIIQSFMNMTFDVKTVKSLGIAFLCMAGTLTMGMLISIPFFNKSGDNKAIFKYAVNYGNMGYMALPLCQAMLGNEGVFYCSAGVVAFNIFSFTHGIWVMTKSKGNSSFDFKKLLFNPGVISVLIGMPFFIFDINLPQVFDTAIGHVSNLNTPLAMLFFGTYIANTDLKNMFKLKENYLVALLKLLALPAIMLGIYKLVGVSGTLLSACMISASVPSANNTVMFSAKYGKDTGVASQVVAFNSGLSVLTIPLMVALSGFLDKL